MNYFKICALIIALFQAQVLWSMETVDGAVVTSKGKRQVVSGDGKNAVVDTVAALSPTEETLVVYTPRTDEKKRRMEGSFGQVYITTGKMVGRGFLTIDIPLAEMHLSEFSVLKERVARGLLKVEIPPARGPFIECEGLIRRLIEGYLRAASMYYEGYKVTENKGTALYYFKSAARKGSSRGLFHTALMLDMGDGVPTDKVRAADLYALAMHKGHPVALYNLAMMLVNREVGESYPGEAIGAAIFLAQRGMPFAQEILGRMGIPW
ncbi:MAG: sel1 repeat family protein [Alphaproteobacteria bacterium]|nr:sel1 repeat family protein [Alphaproteobacteria bacterium]